MHTLFPAADYRSLSARQIGAAVREALDKFRPVAVAINGWSVPEAVAALRWCRRNGAKAILMSESHAVGYRRSGIKEWVKSWRVRRFDAALVGGSPHRDYVVQLGMPAEKVFLGYDVVDNGHFWAGAEAARRGGVRCRVSGVRGEWGEQKVAKDAKIPEEDEPRSHGGTEGRAEGEESCGNSGLAEFRQTQNSRTDLSLGKEGGGADERRNVQCSTLSEPRTKNQERRTRDNPTTQQPSNSATELSPHSTLDTRHSPPKNQEPRTTNQEPRTTNQEPGTGPTGPYFFANCRFIKRKNLDGLLRAYAMYRKQVDEPWGLVISGSGEEEQRLKQLARELGIYHGGLGGMQERGTGEESEQKVAKEAKPDDSSLLPLRSSVCFPGFLQYAELPAWYGMAGAFVHPAHTEAWGLVVNEACACGVPVLVAKTAGARFDLVREGENGFLFEPGDDADIARALVAVTRLTAKERRRMGERSREIVSEWGPERFGRGLRDALRACGVMA